MDNLYWTLLSGAGPLAVDDLHTSALSVSGVAHSACGMFSCHGSCMHLDLTFEKSHCILSASSVAWEFVVNMTACQDTLL